MVQARLVVVMLRAREPGQSWARMFTFRSNKETLIARPGLTGSTRDRTGHQYRVVVVR